MAEALTDYLRQAGIRPGGRRLGCGGRTDRENATPESGCPPAREIGMAQSPGFYLDVALLDGIQNALDVRLSVNPGEGSSQLPEEVDVAIAHHGFPVLLRNGSGSSVEVETWSIKTGRFDGIEDVDVLLQKGTETNRAREIRMGRYNQSVLA